MPSDRSFPDNWRNGLWGPISPCGWELPLYLESRDVTWNDNHWKGPLLFVVTGSVRTCILFYVIKITHEKMSISRPELVCSLHIRRCTLKDFFLSTYCCPYLMLFAHKMENIAAFKICFWIMSHTCGLTCTTFSTYYVWRIAVFGFFF